MTEKPFEKANKLMRTGARVNLVGVVVFIALTIVSGAMHNTPLMIVFLVLAILCSVVGFSFTLAGVRRNNADVREIVQQARAGQERRHNC